MTSESLYRNCRNCKNMVLKSAKNCAQCGKKQKNFVKILKYVGLALLAWIIIRALIHKPTDSSLANINTHSSLATINPQDEVRKMLKLDFVWEKDGFDLLMKADFTIHNNSDYVIKDVQIKCEHFTNSETKIDQNTEVIYEVINAKSKRTFKDVSMGFINRHVKSSSCDIERFSIVQ